MSIPSLLIRISSRKWIARLVGRLANTRASRHLIPFFIRSYHINTAEAEKSPAEYPTWNAYFTRRLRAGARTVDPDPATVVSPVDARLTAYGPITASTILHVKGQTYRIDDLLGDAQTQPTSEAGRFTEGYFFVLYLSPTDYHRIHTPCDGIVRSKRHLPGKVYPVHDYAMTHIPQVLTRNERLITYLDHSRSSVIDPVAVVKVGAMNVASIRYVAPFGNGSQLYKGEELAYFEFGSTVVLLIGTKQFAPRADLQHDDRVRQGETLGRWL